MKTSGMPVEVPHGRRDFVLESAYQEATDGAITAPNTLQRALFPRLSSQDTGLLVQTGPGAGRLEAVFVPVMMGGETGRQRHRLYIIAPDNSLLDDYLYRLSSYVRGLAVARGSSLTFYIEGAVPFCREYHPDGSFEHGSCNHPLDADVDLVVAHYTSFRSLFFGAGGVHALPGKTELEEDLDIQFEQRRRDLFFFDEAQSYDGDDFIGFVRLVEFLYAEDLDVLVGTTTLPPACQEELLFLEILPVEDAVYQPPRTIMAIAGTKNEELDIIVGLVKDRYFESSRVGIVRETAEESVRLYERLSLLYPRLVFNYHSAQSKNERLTTYAHLRELEKEGEGYLLICDSKAIDCADIDVNLLVTSMCAPESLIRRAGRCNRRGDLANGEIIVVGSSYYGRTLRGSGLRSYIHTIQSFAKPTEFSVAALVDFIT